MERLVRMVCGAGVVASVCAATVGCGGGRYGYARTYTYLGDEESYARRASADAIYDEVRRMPDRYGNQMLSWFGTVTRVEAGRNGESRVALQIRTHQERHLCEDESEGSCRVTISEQAGGPFTVVVRLSPEDSLGENRVQAVSLLRVYGTLVPGEYDAEGGPVLRASHYRHWPRGQYVTTAAAGAWRR